MTGAPSPARPHLRLVPDETRIVVSDERSPIGRSRAFRLTENDVELLIAAAMRLEARRA